MARDFVLALQEGDAALAINTLLATAIILLICFPVHELAHAVTANRLGDDTARLLGRISLNPLRHLDLAGTFLFLLSGFGWAKPVPVNPNRLNGNPRVSFAIVAFAGPMSNLVMAVAFALVFRIFRTSDTSFAVVAFYLAVQLNVLLAIFNLLPIPPLDGSRVLAAVLPPEADAILATLQQYGFVILIALTLLAPGVMQTYVYQPANAVALALMGLR